MRLNQSTKILIVDDYATMVKITKECLISLGVSEHNLYSALNGAEALEVLNNQRVDLVILDLMMPVMSGNQLLKVIRANPQLGNLPVLIVTGEPDRNSIQEAVMNGASSLLLKPFSREKLSQHIQIAFTAPLRSSPRLVNAASNNGNNAPTQNDEDTAVVLIVDDVQDNLLLLMRLLQPMYKVRVANNGEKALAICQSDNPPDLVLLDIMMPGLDGFEVGKKLREHPVSKAIPIIFVTAMGSMDAKLKGLELGAVDVITKPIEPALLRLKVQNFLGYVNLYKQLQGSYDSMLAEAALKEDIERITRDDVNSVLASAIKMVQKLADDKTLEKRQVARLHEIESAALQAVNMISLSLILYKIEKQSFILQATEIDIDDVLRRIVEMFRVSFHYKKLTIAIETDVPVGHAMPKLLGDEMLCYSVFQNLLKYACEMAPENTKITVNMHEESPLRFVIQNAGCVPEESRHSFFEKFAVSDNKLGADSLGMYSSRLLCEAQNGSIQLDVSDEFDTTSITVCLPRVD